MGLWLLSGVAAHLEPARPRVDLADAARRRRRAARPVGAVVDPDDPVFLPPGDMPARIAARLRATGQPVRRPRPAVVVRCILDSLAAGLSPRRPPTPSGSPATTVDVVHIVGGGAQNALLCQLTADACGQPVVAGPVEATALGNLLVQARTLGAVSGDLAALRARIRAAGFVEKGTSPATDQRPINRPRRRAPRRAPPGTGRSRPAESTSGGLILSTLSSGPSVEISTPRAFSASLTARPRVAARASRS